MNSRLTFPAARLAPGSITRAQLSPVGSSRRVRSVTARAGAYLESVVTVPAVPSSPGELRAALPAWHRGPLDRLQPILTRFRD